MSQTKFTPPPWRVVEEDDFVMIRAHGVTNGKIGYAVANGYSAEQRLANAQLMAAAPDLFFVLEALLKEVDENGDDLDQWVLADLIAGARSALAKARGEA